MSRSLTFFFAFQIECYKFGTTETIPEVLIEISIANFNAKKIFTPKLESKTFDEKSDNIIVKTGEKFTIETRGFGNIKLDTKIALKTTEKLKILADAELYNFNVPKFIGLCDDFSVIRKTFTVKEFFNIRNL